MSVFATQTQTQIEPAANNIVRFSRDSSSSSQQTPANKIGPFSRGNTSDLSKPEAPTSRNNAFLENGVRAISALVTPRTLAAVCAFLLHFNRVHPNYASYNRYKDSTCEYVGELSRVTIRSSSKQAIGPSTVYSTAHTPEEFLKAKLADTMVRLKAARENPESVRLEVEAREAVDKTMSVAYSPQNEAARASLSPEMQENLATIGNRYFEQHGHHVVETFAVSVTRG
jgi:hypothetical protein